MILEVLFYYNYREVQTCHRSYDKIIRAKIDTMFGGIKDHLFKEKRGRSLRQGTDSALPEHDGRAIVTAWRSNYEAFFVSQPKPPFKIGHAEDGRDK